MYIFKKFVQLLMQNGNKNVAYGLVWSTFFRMRALTSCEAFGLFKMALFNATPLFELKISNKGRRSVQSPLFSSDKRRQSRTLRLMVDYSSRTKKDLASSLSREIYNNFVFSGNACVRKHAMNKKLPPFLQVF